MSYVDPGRLDQEYLTIKAIAAVIVNWNQADLTIRAVRSIQGMVESIYIVDNDSRDDEFIKLVAAFDDSDVRLIRAETNLGYAGGNNLAADAALAAGHDALMIMNNDALAEPRAIETLRGYLDIHPAVGVAMPTVLSIDGLTVLHGRCRLRLWSGAVRWEGVGLSADEIPVLPQPTDYVSGEAFLCRAEVIRQCGFFDERFFCYYEDVDWSVRVVRAGWRLDYVPGAHFLHEVGGSGASITGAFYRARNLILLQRYGLGRSRGGALVRSLMPLGRSATVHLLRGRGRPAQQVVAGVLAGLRDESERKTSQF
jgi:GT2 family glycosyltransferase